MTTLTTSGKASAPMLKVYRRASDADRKRISRDNQAAKGVKQFCLKVGGIHLKYIEALTIANPDQSAGQVLKQIIEAALDRHVGVQNRIERMRENGATDEEVQRFIITYLNPPLPA